MLIPRRVFVRVIKQNSKADKLEISTSAWRGVGVEEEWLAFEPGKSSAGSLHRVGAGELQGESKEAQSVREILCRL